MIKFNVTVIDIDERAKADADPNYAPKERVKEIIMGKTEADVRRSFRRLQKLHGYEKADLVGPVEEKELATRMSKSIAKPPLKSLQEANANWSEVTLIVAPEKA